MKGIDKAPERLTAQIQYKVFHSSNVEKERGFLRIYFSTNGISSFPFSLTGKESKLIAKKAAINDSGSYFLLLAPSHTTSSVPAINLNLQK
jgi:hypothetical protein